MTKRLTFPKHSFQPKKQLAYRSLVVSWPLDYKEASNMLIVLLLTCTSKDSIRVIARKLDITYEGDMIS